MISDIFKYQFLQNALMAGVLAAIIGGIIGTIIIERKIVLMSGGIAHTSYGGVGLGYLLNFSPLLGALIFSLIASLSIGTLEKKQKNSSSIFISLFWSLGMGLGVLFTSLMKQYPPDINAYLFGDILSVSRSDLLLMLGLFLVIILFLVLSYNNLKSFLFDPEFYKVRKKNAYILEYMILILVAFSVVLLIKICGIILLLSILVAPAATTKLFAKKFSSRIIYSSILGFVYIFIGFVVSYYANISSGASIVVCSIFMYFLIYFIKSIIDKRQKTKSLSV